MKRRTVISRTFDMIVAKKIERFDVSSLCSMSAVFGYWVILIFRARDLKTLRLQQKKFSHKISKEEFRKIKEHGTYQLELFSVDRRRWYQHSD